MSASVAASSASFDRAPATQFTPPSHRHLTLVELPEPESSTSSDSAVDLEIEAPASRFVQSLAMIAFEIIEGSRSIGQLGQSVTLAAARQIANYRAARSDQRKILGSPPLSVRHIGKVRIDRPSVRVAEAAAVIYAGQRARAIAMRLEWEHSRWRASDIVVL